MHAQLQILALTEHLHVGHEFREAVRGGRIDDTQRHQVIRCNFGVACEHPQNLSTDAFADFGGNQSAGGVPIFIKADVDERQLQCGRHAGRKVLRPVGECVEPDEDFFLVGKLDAGGVARPYRLRSDQRDVLHADHRTRSGRQRIVHQAAEFTGVPQPQRVPNLVHHDGQQVVFRIGFAIGIGASGIVGTAQRELAVGLRSGVDKPAVPGTVDIDADGAVERLSQGPAVQIGNAEHQTVESDGHFGIVARCHQPARHRFVPDRGEILFGQAVSGCTATDRVRQKRCGTGDIEVIGCDRCRTAMYHQGQAKIDSCVLIGRGLVNCQRLFTVNTSVTESADRDLRGTVTCHIDDIGRVDIQVVRSQSRHPSGIDIKCLLAGVPRDEDRFRR